MIEEKQETTSTRLSLAKVRQHFQGQNAVNGGSITKEDFQTFVKGSMAFDSSKKDLCQKYGNNESFFEFVFKTRSEQQQSNVVVMPYDISMTEAVKQYYGAELKTFLYDVFGINFSRHTLSDVARLGGRSKLNAQELIEMSASYSRYDFGQHHQKFGSNTISDFQPIYNFLLPEIFMEVMRVGFQAQSLAGTWTGGSTMQVRQQGNLFMPYIGEGDAYWRKRGEGEDIKIATEVNIYMKRFDVHEYAVGATITDELLEQSTLDVLAEHLSEINRNFFLCGDTLALNNLINGEKAYLNNTNTPVVQSAPVIGVSNTIAGWQFEDIRRVLSQMDTLMLPANHAIYRLESETNLATLPEWTGYNGETRTLEMPNINPRLINLGSSKHLPPADQMLLINTANALTEVTVGGMVVEEARDAKQGRNNIYFRRKINYVKKKRAACMILDRSLDFASNGFPVWADYSEGINKVFIDV